MWLKITSWCWLSPIHIHGPSYGERPSTVDVRFPNQLDRTWCHRYVLVASYYIDTTTFGHILDCELDKNATLLHWSRFFQIKTNLPLNLEEQISYILSPRRLAHVNIGIEHTFTKHYYEWNLNRQTHIDTCKTKKMRNKFLKETEMPNWSYL